ncbi:MAG: TIR domain-containing protein, partial [Anaerolineales bacterium]|nr:TIR domain-containing protein [Anaerolineales bacterium]
MTDIFISYSRKDIAFARLLHEALKESSFETWIDWQDIPPSTDWLSEVYTAIEQADTFIFILSSASTLSEVCQLEIEHARKNNKRLIPIVINEVDPTQVHPALAALNWIFSRTEDEFQPAIQSLVTAIQTDYEWAKAHTRLQMRALEWERAGNDKSFLLRGADLSQAENWIAVAAEKIPEPTLLQARYLQASRQEETQRQQEQLQLEQKLRQRQRFALWVVGVGLIVAVVLGFLAWMQRNEAVQQSNIRATAESNAIAEAHSRATAESKAVAEAHSRATAEVLAVNEANVRATAQAVAEEQRNTAQAGLISALAMGRSNDHYDLALLLAGAAYQKLDTFESRRGLFQVLIANPDLQYFLYGHADTVYDLAFSPDGSRIASASADGTFILWDAVQRAPVLDPISVDGNAVISVAFSPDSKLLATGHCTKPNPQTGCDEGKVFLWDAADGQQLGEMAGTLLGSPLSIAFSHNGKLLAAGDLSGQIHLWDLSSFQRVG